MTESLEKLRAANYVQLSPFSTSLESSFSDTRGSLNFLSVHSCRAKPSPDKLYVCVEVSLRTKGVRLNFYQWCKTPSSAFSKKISATTPNFFARFRSSP